MKIFVDPNSEATAASLRRWFPDFPINTLDEDWVFNETGVRVLHPRFLVPALCGYQGTALYVARNTVCVGTHEFRAFNDEWLACRMRPVARREGWSDLMYLNCSKFKHYWTPTAVAGAPSTYLQELGGISDSKIIDIRNGATAEDLRWLRCAGPPGTTVFGGAYYYAQEEEELSGRAQHRMGDCV